ncbi:MAG: type II toxin-antitoxin system VapC family toxin [Methylobacteriaceae bacterium]|nr:type II toxin-antitoxin system VapC family toxin [Methylobacteriaceae bacterium]
MNIVLDASMALAWLFEAERTAATDDVLRRVAGEGGIAPSLWRLEVASAFQIAVRRGRCDETYVDRSLQNLTELPIVIDDETDDHAWGATKTLAREHGLTLYDAAYLELALRLQRPLASCDATLIRAARKCGVEILSAT